MPATTEANHAIDGANAKPSTAGPFVPTESEFADAIASYDAALPPGRVMRFKLSPLDRVEVPVWIASFRGDDGLLIDGIGYGETDEEALCGAYGELTETTRTHERMKDLPTHVGWSFEQAQRKLGKDTVVDPRRLGLTAGTEWTADETPSDWVCVRRIVDDAPRWVPREFVAHRGSQLAGSPPLITTITNGLGAGPTQPHAIEHALCELLQRDGNCTAFRAMDPGTAIELDTIEDSGLRRLLDRVDQLGIHVHIKLARTDFGHVNVFVVGHDLDQDPWFGPQVTACGEAAHPDREIAVRKALLEFLAARSRKAFMHGPLDRIDAIAPKDYLPTYFERFRIEDEEPRALRSMMQWVEQPACVHRERLASSIFDVKRSVRLSDLPTRSVGMGVSGAPGRLQFLVEELDREGIEVLYLDLSDDHSRNQGVHAVRVLAPGLECETMSYGRIGYRGVLRGKSEQWPFLSESRSKSHRQQVLMTDADRHRAGGDAFLDFDRIDDVVGDLYPLYREPRSHSVQRALAAANPSPV